MIQKNKDNQDSVVIDFRTPEEYATRDIENAVNIDYYVGDRTDNSRTLRDELNKLDRNEAYRSTVWLTSVAQKLGKSWSISFFRKFTACQVKLINGKWKDYPLQNSRVRHYDS